jgi:hypothetical protein
VSKLLSLAKLFRAAISMPKSSYCASVGISATNLSYRDLAEMMAERVSVAPSHHSALGPALRSGVREALESRLKLKLYLSGMSKFSLTCSEPI